MGEGQVDAAEDGEGWKQRKRHGRGIDGGGMISGMEGKLTGWDEIDIIIERRAKTTRVNGMVKKLGPPALPYCSIVMQLDGSF